MKNLAKMASEGKYTEFRQSLFSEMASRMQNNRIINEYNRQMDYYNDISRYMKSIPSLDEYKK
jgi:hypothetical protein